MTMFGTKTAGLEKQTTCPHIPSNPTTQHKNGTYRRGENLTGGENLTVRAVFSFGLSKMLYNKDIGNIQ